MSRLSVQPFAAHHVILLVGPVLAHPDHRPASAERQPPFEADAGVPRLRKVPGVSVRDTFRPTGMVRSRDSPPSLSRSRKPGVHSVSVTA